MTAPTRKRHYTPEPSTTNAPRQRRLRERRKADGWRRVTVWLSPEQVERLETLGGDAWLGRTVKALLARSVSVPSKPPAPVSGSGGNPDKAAFLADVDSLKAQGLSWEAIARRWNDEGRRTERGAAFRGANIARDWRKWKGEGK